MAVQVNLLCSGIISHFTSNRPPPEETKALGSRYRVAEAMKKDDMCVRIAHGCQMAIAGFLDHTCLALRASGVWLRYAKLQNLIPFFPWIAPHALNPGEIQGKEGIKFCQLATLFVAAAGSVLYLRHDDDGH